MTIVEFADYECPPCRFLYPEVRSLAQSQNMDVKLVFRNLPLADIHPSAFDAATAAEAAGMQSQFRQMHELLFKGDIDEKAIAMYARKLKLDVRAFERDRKNVARVRVESDVRAAKALGISSTPTFFLCLPDGTVVRAASFGALRKYVASSR